MSEVGVKHTGASQMVGNFVARPEASIKFHCQSELCVFCLYILQSTRSCAL